ncbi:unnamed protein product [Fusarium graminearum]|uniref:Uncharacterized protein n=1 Tax=Gibberella zeae TaxID=5518 RepID=A0A4U9F2N3_GIBZA|nr:unnamed protein product [Fusarium graminearum]CAF3476242.1 unnamed protein product [Fusarium graminearum]CAF3637695.1 unnamed protein product [Fusarium graminearum]CAG1975147.1 unnamed protein product [Fusarium graminearum]CAG1996045.1 unnamed protein product [Fusarium graminearum]
MSLNQCQVDLQAYRERILSGGGLNAAATQERSHTNPTKESPCNVRSVSRGHWLQRTTPAAPPRSGGKSQRQGPPGQES